MLLDATHLNLISALPVGICYADCPPAFIDCDCPPFLWI